MEGYITVFTNSKDVSYLCRSVSSTQSQLKASTFNFLVEIDKLKFTLK